MSTTEQTVDTTLQMTNHGARSCALVGSSDPKYFKKPREVRRLLLIDLLAAISPLEQVSADTNAVCRSKS